MEGLSEWLAGVNPTAAAALITFLPIFELRGSIPFAFFSGIPLWQVLPVIILCNWMVAPVVYLFLKYLLRWMVRWPWFAKIWERYTQRVQVKVERAMKGWGAWGLAIFIGIPLPGSGVYTGALGAYLLGMGFGRFMWVALAGVLIAATAVTAILLTGNGLFSWMVNGSLVPQG